MPRHVLSASLAAAALAVLLTAIAGCAGEETPAPAAEEAPTASQAPPAQPRAAGAATADPCELLTAQEIEAATGVAPDGGQEIGDACSWAAADGSNARLLTMTVLHGSLSREQWLATGGSEDDLVEGVGDLAVRVGSQLQVYQDGWLVGVTVRGSDRPEADRELARAVHARLAG